MHIYTRIYTSLQPEICLHLLLSILMLGPFGFNDHVHLATEPELGRDSGTKPTKQKLK